MNCMKTVMKKKLLIELEEKYERLRDFKTD